MKRANISLGYGIAIGMVIAAIILGILGLIVYFLR
jgi:tetrahydromethanopterin S-methyltransferase subunit F